MNRKQLIQNVRVAGYHEDTATGTRLLINSRLSLAAYNEAFEQGRQSRLSGMKCGCLECKQKEGK